MKTCGKVAFVASLFSNDDVEKSLPYVLPVARNIGAMRGNGLGWDLYVHTDEFTRRIVESVCSSEGIPTDHANFVTHRRNSGMRGMFWRYEAFFMDGLGYDMSVILEGDMPVEAYAADVGVFSETGHQMMLFDSRRMAVSTNCICGGYLFARPGLIDDGAKSRLRAVMDLMDHVDDVDYGVDENVLLMWLRKNFADKDTMIVIDDRHKTFQHIEDVELEKAVVHDNFPGATLVTRDELDRIRSRHGPAALPDIRLRNLSGDSYALDGRSMKVGGWWRAPKSEFCHSGLLEIVGKIV